MTSNPAHLEGLIVQSNTDNGSLYECYCPYTALPDESEQSKAEGLYSLRAALRRYVFVRMLDTIEERGLISAVQTWRRASVHTITFLRNGQGDLARVSHQQLNMMKAYCDQALFKHAPELSLSDLKVGQKVMLSNTPFAEGQRECVIQSVRRKKGGRYELRVELTLFNVRFSNLLVTYEDTSAGSSPSRIVYETQQRLLAIYRRKVNRKETEPSRHQDAQTLQNIFAQRTLDLPEGAMQRHFLALMLICARLMDDRQAVAQYVGLVNAELSILARIRESKAATDSRAWLHIAMFIATGRSRYRDQAKAYIRAYAPKSVYLKQFVKQSCKTAGERWIGVKKQRKSSAPTP